MFNAEIINKYKDQLQKAVSGTTIFYASAYNDGPDVGIRKYGNKNNRVEDVQLDGICWLIAGDAFFVKDGAATRLSSCQKISKTHVENIVVELRAQGMVNGVIDIIPLGLFLVKDKSVVNDEFGLLRLK